MLDSSYLLPFFSNLDPVHVGFDTSNLVFEGSEASDFDKRDDSGSEGGSTPSIDPAVAAAANDSSFDDPDATKSKSD